MKGRLEKAVCGFVGLAVILSAMCSVHVQAGELPWMKGSIAKLEGSLVAKYGDGVRANARRGMEQVAEFWRSEDGDAAAFEEFVLANFAGDTATNAPILWLPMPSFFQNFSTSSSMPPRSLLGSLGL